MKTVSTLIVGAGQAGLAMSLALKSRDIDHVLLERGSVGHAWRTQRWDSLTTLTPNWANGLPGAPYVGADPNGFMPVSELVRNLESAAAKIDAPVQRDTDVQSVTRRDDGFQVDTSNGPFRCRSLVVATGACAQAHLPAVAAALPHGVEQTTPARYKRPGDLPDGQVLVVGASASGVQIARELARAGRSVILSVGSHMRLPRRYRGHDIESWLDLLGFMDERADDIDDLLRARHLPSPQLQGGSDPVDLNALQSLGVTIVGRLVDIRGDRAVFSGGLSGLVTGADLKMTRLLDDVDRWVHSNGLERLIDGPDRPADTRLALHQPLDWALGQGGIRSVFWATGFRPSLQWLTLPAFDARLRLRHRNGVVTVPGIYAMGLPILRRRRSHQISGVEGDAKALSEHLHGFLNGRAGIAA
ncbi:MAG: NAD(P)-binding domain-containing protein [Pseudomonadota bacterium]